MKSHRQDKETKISELSHTIQILSTKSDLHHELAQSKQDLHLEKLLVENLRRDLETYQSMIKIEQSKSEKLRKELLEYQSSRFTSQVIESIETIPGVQPSKLIEIFSLRTKLLEDEIIKLQLNEKKNTEKSENFHYDGEHDGLFKEIYNSLLHKSNEDFLSSLDTALLVRKIIELEDLLKKKITKIHELSQELINYQEEKSMRNNNGNSDNLYDSNSTEKLLILHQNTLNQAKEEISALKYQLDRSQEKENNSKSHILHLTNTVVCLSCQKRIESLQDSDLNDQHDIHINNNHIGEIEHYEYEIENLKSLVRERTSQVIYSSYLSIPIYIHPINLCH